jgi:hypothetical protein
MVHAHRPLRSSEIVISNALAMAKLEAHNAARETEEFGPTTVQ